MREDVPVSVPLPVPISRRLEHWENEYLAVDPPWRFTWETKSAGLRVVADHMLVERNHGGDSARPKIRTPKKHAEAPTINDPVEKWHHIVLTQDASGLSDFLADDAVFYSPILFAAQRGKEVVTRYLSAALRVFFNPSFRCVRKLVGPSDGLFEFETEIDGVLVNAIDLIKWNDDKRVVEFKVMVRAAQSDPPDAAENGSHAGIDA